MAVVTDVSHRDKSLIPADAQRSPFGEVGHRQRVMTTTVLAISIAYVVMGLVLLGMGLTSRFAWWVKSHRHRGDLGVLRGGVLRHWGCSAGRGWRSCGGASSLLWAQAVEADPERPQSRSDLSLDRGGGREQRPERRATILLVAYSRPLVEFGLEGGRLDMKGKPLQGLGGGYGGS